MKGGKAGRGRNTSNAQHGKKKAKTAGKKKGAPRSESGAPRKNDKRTTKLGAVRNPDDD